MSKDFKTEIINTKERVADLVDLLVQMHGSVLPNTAIMYIDLEGMNLCREGSISIFTLLLSTGASPKTAYLIDVHTLGADAFNTSGKGGETLKAILQDETIPKVFFDVRNDSDALFAHFGVALQGVQDVQLMENATRKNTGSRKFLSGLAKCIADKSMTFGGSGSWKAAKEKGELMFSPSRGGSYAVFNQRPIPQDIVDYCVGDVQYLPELRRMFWYARDPKWQHLVSEEAKNRVAMSQRQDYQPNGRHKALAPWSEEQNRVLDRYA